MSVVWNVRRKPINLGSRIKVKVNFGTLQGCHALHCPCYCYCKRGYFRWGKISRKCWQDISRGGNFHDISPISLIKSYGFYFRAGEIFAKKVISRKTRILPPRENFHVYSIIMYKGEVRWIGCLTSQSMVFQSYMWRHIDVQADWRRSWTYGRAPNSIDIL